MSPFPPAVLPGVGWDATAPESVVESPAQLRAVLRALESGGSRIVAGRFPWRETVRELVAELPLWWFPVEPDGRLWRACVERPARQVAASLEAYLAREHRLIEAAWEQAPRGRAFRWRLERHMRVEEQLLFPEWTCRGDRPGWALGLAAEHDLLREPVLNSRIHLRAFRERLDSHDEKGERVFYPALVECLGDDSPAVLREAMLVSV